jgi:hypothetical protein
MAHRRLVPMCSTEPNGVDVTPLDAALVAWQLHQELALKVMGLVTMIEGAKQRGTDFQTLDTLKLREACGLADSTAGMHDCLTWLCPEMPTRAELDGPDDDDEDDDGNVGGDR